MRVTAYYFEVIYSPFSNYYFMLPQIMRKHHLKVLFVPSPFHKIVFICEHSVFFRIPQVISTTTILNDQRERVKPIQWEITARTFWYHSGVYKRSECSHLKKLSVYTGDFTVENLTAIVMTKRFTVKHFIMLLHRVAKFFRWEFGLIALE